jgi:copper transport protein
MQWYVILTFVTEVSLIFWVGAQFWPAFVWPFVQWESQEQILLYQQVERRFERYTAVPLLLVLFLAQPAIPLLATSLSSFSPRTISSIPYWLVREVTVALALTIALYCLVSEHRPSLAKFFTVWINVLLALLLLIATVLSQLSEGGNEGILVGPALGDWFHLLSASLWLGGIIYIAMIYLPVLKCMEPGGQLRSLLSLFPSVSLLFLIGIIFALTSGFFDTMQQHLSWEQFLSTLYGRLLLIKGLLVGSLLLCSTTFVLWFYPHLKRSYRTGIVSVSEQQSLQGEMPTHRRVISFLALLRWQLLPALAVIFCSALLPLFTDTLHSPLTGQAHRPLQTPPTPQPFVTSAMTTDRLFTVTFTVAPNRSGANRFTVGIVDSKGRAVTQAMVILSSRMQDMDMGINTVTLQPDGYGQFSGIGTLGMPGSWLVRVQLRLPDRTQHQVVIRLVTPA